MPLVATVSYQGSCPCIPSPCTRSRLCSLFSGVLDDPGFLSLICVSQAATSSASLSPLPCSRDVFAFLLCSSSQNLMNPRCSAIVVGLSQPLSPASALLRGRENWLVVSPGVCLRILLFFVSHGSLAQGCGAAGWCTSRFAENAQGQAIGLRSEQLLLDLCRAPKVITTV
jgi:hypothetical protein